MLKFSEISVFLELPRMGEFILVVYLHLSNQHPIVALHLVLGAISCQVVRESLLVKWSLD